MHGGDHHRWELDPIPMVVDRADWDPLSRALAQRAAVLDAVLADTFGEQRLLRSGMLPTDAIVAHRDYLRPAIGVPPGGRRHLVLHAADLTRGNDGTFTVLADRCQAPSGAGYTLENREVLTSTFPELVRRCGVEPLRPWFSALRLTLAQVAPPGVDDPRIVILTPGPLSATYFEHGSLSRALGYTLVEPSDLTVRDGHVWLKSVTGLEPVHVILRRLDAEWCDSLELRPDSLLGVPGLLEAARRRNVSIVNPLGSGLAENPALLPHLPALARALLGEDLLLPSAPTWWCGDPSSRSHVLTHLRDLVIKPIDRGPGRQSIFARTLSTAELEDLAARITARPHLFVGQEEQPLSTAPAVDSSTITPRYAVLRAFLVADHDGYTTMDGGLTRTAATPGEVTMSTGGVSKDTWIIAPSSEQTWTSRRAVALPLVDLRDSVTSSTASAMYWIGRNHERAETVVRLVRSIDETLGMWPELRDEAGGSWLQLMGAAVHAVVDDDHEEPATVDSALVAALGDPRHARSLVTSLQYLLVGGRSVRERLSPDAWRMLAELEEIHPLLEHASPIEARELADATIAPLSALSGLMTEAMVRDAGWRFLDLGRRIERSSLMCRLLTATMGAPPPESIAAPVYETILAGWECLGAYRRRHRSDVERPAMFALLFTDTSNPRSLRFQVERMSDDVAELPRGHDQDRLVAVVGELGDALEDLGPVQLAQLDDAGRHRRLQQLLDRVHSHLEALEEIVELGYFAQVGPGTVLGTEAAAPQRRGPR